MSRIYKKSNFAGTNASTGIAFGGGGGGGGTTGKNGSPNVYSNNKSNAVANKKEATFNGAPTRVSEGAIVSRGNYIADRTGNSTGTRVANVTTSKNLSDEEKRENLKQVGGNVTAAIGLAATRSNAVIGVAATIGGVILNNM